MRLECKHVWAHISEYLDHTLDAELLAQIELHLEHSGLHQKYLAADSR